MSHATAADPRLGRALLRALRWLLAGILVLALVLALLAIPLTALPETVAVPTEPDAVVVLAGGSGERLDTALGLMDRQVGPPADLLLLSNPASAEDPEVAELCGTARAAYAVACFTPDPETTAGEAQEIAAIAAGQGWERLAVVTSTYHATRARRRLERCTDVDIQMVAASPDAPAVERARASLRELVALARDAVDGGGC